MLKRYFRITGIYAALLLILGCSGMTPNSEDSMVNRNWGRSHGTAIYNQMVNPDAAKNLDPVEGLDGTAADNNVKKYQDSFKEEGPQEVVNILKLQ